MTTEDWTQFYSTQAPASTGAQSAGAVAEASGSMYPMDAEAFASPPAQLAPESDPWWDELGPNGRTRRQIKGTTYLSDAEQAFYFGQKFAPPPLPAQRIDPNQGWGTESGPGINFAAVLDPAQVDDQRLPTLAQSMITNPFFGSGLYDPRGVVFGEPAMYVEAYRPGGWWDQWVEYRKQRPDQYPPDENGRYPQDPVGFFNSGGGGGASAERTSGGLSEEGFAGVPAAESNQRGPSLNPIMAFVAAGGDPSQLDPSGAFTQGSAGSPEAAITDTFARANAEVNDFEQWKMTLQEELVNQGFTFGPRGEVIPPRGSGLTQADIAEGIRRIRQRQVERIQDNFVKELVEVAQSSQTALPAETAIAKGLTFANIQAAQDRLEEAPRGSFLGLGDRFNRIKDALEFSVRGIEPLQDIQEAVGEAGEFALGNKLVRNLPVVGSVAGDIAALVNAAEPFTGVSSGDVGREAAKGFIPTTPLEIALAPTAFGLAGDLGINISKRAAGKAVTKEIIEQAIEDTLPKTVLPTSRAEAVVAGKVDDIDWTDPVIRRYNDVVNSKGIAAAIRWAQKLPAAERRLLYEAGAWADLPPFEGILPTPKTIDELTDALRGVVRQAQEREAGVTTRTLDDFLINTEAGPTRLADVPESQAKQVVKNGAAGETNVVRVAVKPAAVEPLDEGLAASRGAVRVTDPSGVRILGPNEAPAAGEQVMFHGTGTGGVQGALRQGTNLTPNEADAGAFSRATQRLEQRANAAGPPARPPTEPPAAGGAPLPPSASEPDFIKNIIEFLSPVNLGNELRQAVAGLDFSNVLRQGWLSVRHGPEWLASVGSGARGMVDESYAIARNTAIQANERARNAGLFIGDLPGFRTGKSGITKREENFAGNLMSQVPGYKQTGRGNVLMLNEVREKTFNVVTNAWDRGGWRGWFARPGDEESLARYINRATGRGTLGPAENTWLESALGFGFFSPRYQLSRPQAALNMLNFAHPRVMMEAWKDFGASFAATVSLLALANESGAAKVNLDPTSSDFGKFKIGNTRIDPWAGYQQLATLTARMLSGDITDDQKLEYLKNFGRYKLSPLVGRTVDVTTGKDFLGRDYSVFKGFGKNLDGFDGLLANIAASSLPIVVQGLLEASRDGLLGESLKSLPASFFGLGTQTYPPSQSQQMREESRIAIEEMIGTVFPEELRATIGGADYNSLTSKERAALKAHADATGNTELQKLIAAREEARDKRNDVFERARDDVKVRNERAQPVFDQLYEAIFGPQGGKSGWDKIREEMAKERDKIYYPYDSEERRKAIAELPSTDIQRVQAEYDALWNKAKMENSGLPDYNGWKRLQIEFIADLAARDRDLANRLVWNIQQESPTALPEHKIFQFVSDVYARIQPYYESGPSASKQREAYRVAHPDVDFLLWLTGVTTTVKTQAAADLARKLTTGREVRIAK